MRLPLIIASLLTTSLAGASTPINGWYAGAFGGYTYVPNNVRYSVNGLTRTDASYDSGYDAGGNIGFKSNPMRYEGELTYIHADLNSFKVNNFTQTGVSGYNYDILAMANVYYDFPNLLNTLQPFLGVGIGYAWVYSQLDSTGPLTTTYFSGSNSAFAYQGLAGITYNFAENWALNLGYRYVATVKVNNLGAMFQAQMGNLGVVYRFDEGNYK